MFDWLYIDIPKENMGNKGESRQIPDQDFQYPIIPDWLNIWYQYPYPIRTRSDPKYFFQYPIHTRPEVKKPYPSDPANVSPKWISSQTCLQPLVEDLLQSLESETTSTILNFGHSDTIQVISERAWSWWWAIQKLYNESLLCLKVKIVLFFT